MNSIVEMNIDAPIIAGKSIGNICLSANVKEVLSELYQESRRIESRVFNNFGKDYTMYKIDDGALSFVSNHDGFIERIWCSRAYKGMSQSGLKPGLTVRQIIDITNKQLLIHGYLVLDNEFGLCYSIPIEYEEYDDILFVPKKLVLDELHVVNENWWR